MKAPLLTESARQAIRGFTLMELLVCLAIIGFLASVAMPLAEMSRQRQKEADLRIALREIRDAIDAYKSSVDSGRVRKAADSSGYPPSLSVLVEGAVDLKSPSADRVYFLRRIPRDPFHPNADLLPEKTWGLRSYASPSERPRPGKDVFDIFSLSTEEGINGIPYREW